MVTEWFKPQNMLKYTHERVSLVAQMVKTPPAMQETQVQFLSQEDPWRKEWQPTPLFLPGKFHVAWQATVHRVTKNRTQLINEHL